MVRKYYNGLTDEQIAAGKHGADKSSFSFPGTEFDDEFRHNDAERVADAVNDEVGEEGGEDNHPAPPAVRWHRRPQLVDFSRLIVDIFVVGGRFHLTGVRRLRHSRCRLIVYNSRLHLSLALRYRVKTAKYVEEILLPVIIQVLL